MSACLKWAALAGLLLLSACQWLRGAPPPLPLIAPAALGQQWQLTQRVTFESTERTGQPQAMLAAWSVENGVMNVVGLTATGQTLMSLRYDGEQFTANYSPLLPEALPGRDILALIEMTYWPRAAVQNALLGSDWTLHNTADGRQLRLGNRAAVDIQITPINTDKQDGMATENITITHHLLQLRLHIVTLQKVTLQKATP